MAPEMMIKNSSYDTSIDAYALGILLYNLITGQMPFNGSDKQIKTKTLNKRASFKQKAWK